MIRTASGAPVLSVFELLERARQLWRTQRVACERRTLSIMGTETVLKAIVRPGNETTGGEALDAAETVLRDVEARMSVWMGFTELARFNSAAPGDEIQLSPETLTVMQAAREVSEQTRGAFDPTCRPVLEVWRESAAHNREPNSAELSHALDRVGWHLVRLHEHGAEKLRDDVSVDLGGVAKGYAVERAAQAMRTAGATGGMVQCGGDMYVFGPSEHGPKWSIGISDPCGPQEKLLAEVLQVTDRAVSTSGNYRRFFTIRGRRLSHIIDPRNGRPVDAVPQVTVVARSAMVSEGWSTALSVLGPAGLRLLPTGVEAMLITHDDEGRLRIFKSERFEELVQPSTNSWGWHV